MKLRWLSWSRIITLIRSVLSWEDLPSGLVSVERFRTPLEGGAFLMSAPEIAGL